MAMARSLLKSMHVPGRFWGEAVRHAVHLLNRLPTKALGERTPFEAWTGRKPHLAHLRVFGCISYAKVMVPYLNKLDDHSQPMVYLGVEEGCKAHRLYDPRLGKLHISRDVIFQEDVEWKWDEGVDGVAQDLQEFIMLEDLQHKPVAGSQQATTNAATTVAVVSSAVEASAAAATAGAVNLQQNPTTGEATTPVPHGVTT